MKSKAFPIAVIVIFALVALVGLWQHTLYQKLSKTDMSCGGDWSYMAKCPLGSYCHSLGQGPLVGGICRSWLSPVLGFLRSPKEQEGLPSPVEHPSPTVPIIKTENWQTFSNGNFLYSVKYPDDWPTAPSIGAGEKTSGGGLHGPELKGQTIYLSKYLPDVKPPHLQIESFLNQAPSDFENREASSCSAPTFDVTETTIDGAPAVVGHRLASDEPDQPYSTGHQYCALIYKSNTIHSLTWGEGSFKDSGLFNQILPTLKFLN